LIDRLIVAGVGKYRAVFENVAIKPDFVDIVDIYRAFVHAWF